MIIVLFTNNQRSFTHHQPTETMQKFIISVTTLIAVIVFVSCQEDQEAVPQETQRASAPVTFSEEEIATFNSVDLQDFAGEATRVNRFLFSRYVLFTVFSHYQPAIIENGISFVREGELLLPPEYPVYGNRPVAAGTTIEVYNIVFDEEDRSVTAQFRINAIFPPVDSLSEEDPELVTVEARDIYRWDNNFQLSLSSQYLDEAGTVVGISNFEVITFNPKVLDLVTTFPVACAPVEGLTFDSCTLEFLSESVKLSRLESELYTTLTFVYFDANGNEIARNTLPRTLSIATDPDKL